MEIVLWICLITFASGVIGTGCGGVIAAAFRRDSGRAVSLLLSFAGGVMLAVVCLDLIPESIGEVAGGRGVLLTIEGALIGYVVVWLLNVWIDRHTNREVSHIDKEHPRTADDLDELIHADHLSVHRQQNSKTQLFWAGVVMACAIALHNFPEGMVIGASYAGTEADSLFAGSAFLLAVVIGLHNIPEGMAVAVPLISGGMRKGRAILITAASGFPTMLGALVGYGVGQLSPLALALSLSFASGAMLYVVFGELLPESILIWKSKLPACAMMVGVLLGILIIYI